MMTTVDEILAAAEWDGDISSLPVGQVIDILLCG